MRPLILAICALLSPLALAQRAPVEADSQKTEPPPTQRTKWLDMDYGPFLTTSVARPNPKNPKSPTIAAYKGIAIKLGGESKSAVLFDTDLLAMTGWVNGYVEQLGSMLPHHKGTANVTIQGNELFRATGPGWSRPEDLDQPWDPKEQGPLPKARARYAGLYVHGDDVLLSYTVYDTPVLELPLVERIGDGDAITRTFRVAKSSTPLVLRIGSIGPSVESFGGTQPAGTARAFKITRDGKNETALALFGLPQGSEITETDGHWSLKLPPINQPLTFKLAAWTGMRDSARIFYGWVAPLEPRLDLERFTKGGPRRWNQDITRPGKLGADKGAYVVDDLAVPEDNPWTSWMRTTGLDFFSDGRCAVSTFNGDVWIVSGIDDSLKAVSWKRFATGLYEPLGLKIVDDTVYVRCRDQITRLHDLNKDGEADLYENFNNDGPTNPSYHGFSFELQTDTHGNFYYTRTGHRASPGLAGHGVVHRVSKDGSKDEVVATGLRAPNGLGISPTDDLLVSDNQGNWVPSSKLHLVKPGQFLGYMPQHHRASPPTDFAPPLAWLPMNIDSSSGSPIYVSSDRWGPLKAKWVHTSFGRATLIALLPELIDGQEQSAAVKLPLTFPTGVMRGRFNPKDGQLYLTGVGGGWQAGAPKDGALLRVRYTNKTLNIPTGVTTEKRGVRLHFATPLDPKTAADEQNYAAEQWNYKWSEAYGSPDFSVLDPKKKARDEVEIKSAELSDDRKSVLLVIDDLRPVMQLAITTSIKAADGTPIECDVYKTINRVPKD